MTRTFGILAAIAIALVATACQRESGPDPLKLTGKMFVFNYRLAYATYMITLMKAEAVPDGSVVLARFENPAGGDALTLERKLFPKLEKVVLESPDITCVKKDRPYAVTIEVKGPEGQSLQNSRPQSSPTSTRTSCRRKRWSKALPMTRTRRSSAAARRRSISKPPSARFETGNKNRSVSARFKS